MQSRRRVHRVIVTIRRSGTDHAAISIRVTIPTIHLADSQRVLAKGEADASLDATAEDDALQQLETVDGVVHILKLDKAHRAVRLGAVAQTSIARLTGEERFQFLLSRREGQVADVQGVTGWILVGGIGIDRRCRTHTMTGESAAGRIECRIARIQEMLGRAGGVIVIALCRCGVGVSRSTDGTPKRVVNRGVDL